VTKVSPETLSQAQFFKGLPAPSLETLAGFAEQVRFPAGASLFKEGGDADSCYLVTGGDVALEIAIPGRGQHVIATIHAGEVLGWSWLFPPYTWTFDAQAFTEVDAIRFGAKDLWEAKTTDPVLGHELMTRFAAVLVDRLQATRLQLLDMYGHVG
jgi:CRP/FNR family cyclic AMP-dependent transcriptional regulator